MILLNDFRRQWCETGAEVLAVVESVGASGWYILSREVVAFEAALAASWRLPHCIGVASGLDAIEISLKALGCAPGDAVLTSPISAFATTLAIMKLRAVPVFVDCDDHGLIDLERCRESLRVRPIRFLVPVHLYGHSLDMSALRSLREEFELCVVEDCAQSISAAFDGVPTGSAGQMAATSFYPTKNLGAMGDGGAILTFDAELAARARCLRDYGQTRKNQHDDIGYNSRLSELQAALLRRVYLPRLPEWTKRRQEIAARYLDGISHPGIRTLGAPKRSDSCWHLFPIVVDPDRKADFLTYLRSRGVVAGEHYPVAIPDQSALRNAPHEVIGAIPRARLLARAEVSLPIHPYLTHDEVQSVIEVCNGWGG